MSSLSLVTNKIITENKKNALADELIYFKIFQQNYTVYLMQGKEKSNIKRL